MAGPPTREFAAEVWEGLQWPQNATDAVAGIWRQGVGRDEPVQILNGTP
jgi:hypothetical protein